MTSSRKHLSAAGDMSAIHSVGPVTSSDVSHYICPFDLPSLMVTRILRQEVILPLRAELLTGEDESTWSLAEMVGLAPYFL